MQVAKIYVREVAGGTVNERSEEDLRLTYRSSFLMPGDASRVRSF